MARTRPHMFSFRCSADELKFLQAAASRIGCSASELIRPLFLEVAAARLAQVEDATAGPLPSEPEAATD